MSKSMEIFKRALIATYLVLFLGIAGCSSDDTPLSSNPLPQPSVDCGGSSCID